jgi:malonyl-CoA O-methyltransferase
MPRSRPDAGVEERPVTVRYDSAGAFLHALKAIGAGTPRPDYRPVARGQMRGLLATAGRPFPVTYNVVTVTAAAR